MRNIKLISANCCGEVGDVIIEGVEPPPGKTLLEQSYFLKKDKKLWEFILNEPRGGVFKHVNLLVPPKNPRADMGFIIMEPMDLPPMSGSNSICVATVLLEKNIIPIKNQIMKITLEAPGGLIEVEAECENDKVKKVSITNLPSFVADLDKKISVPGLGDLTVSTAYGGDSFVLVNNSDINIEIKPKNADKIVDICSKITRSASEQLGFKHPQLDNLNYISFCMLMDETFVNPLNKLEGRNTVCIRPKKLDRSPCGTGSSARMAYMYKKNQIKIKQLFESKSILGTSFGCYVKEEIDISNIKGIVPVISGQAWITGEQTLYFDENNPFPQGYRLTDTWPSI
tara:strand:- start:1756 stop:2778 length:1023 start_codon:yes stop_codon:yes gene_type:complete